MLWQAIPLSPLLLLLPAFIWFEYKSRSPWTKALLKALCSLCFVAAAFASVFGAAGGPPAGAAFFVAAFLLSLTGDVLLSLPVKNALPLGLGAFFLAQCCFASAFSARWGLSARDVAAFALLAGAALLTLAYAPGMAYGKMKAPAFAYALALSAMGAKAVSGLTLSPGAGAWLAAAGGLLFYTSDVILSFVVFNKKKPACLRALNLITYYVGQGLLALSLAY